MREREREGKEISNLTVGGAHPGPGRRNFAEQRVRVLESWKELEKSDGEALF